MEFKFSIFELSDRIENFKKQKIYRWNSAESLNPFERFLGQCLAFVTFALIAIFIILSELFLLGIFVLLCLAVIAFAVFIIISIGTIATIILGIIVNIIIAAKATLLIMALEMKSNYTKFDVIKNSQDATKWESDIVTFNKARMKLKPAKNFIFALTSIWKVIVFFCHDVKFSRFLQGFDFRSFWGFNIPIFFLYFMKLILELILPDKNYLNIDISGQIILNDDLFEAINQKSSRKVESDLLYPFRSWKSNALMIPCAWIFIHFVLRIYFRFNKKINKDFDDDVELDTRPLEKNLINFYDKDTKVTGICGEVWNALSEYLNFTLFPIKIHDTTFGGRLPNGTYTGLLGILQRREIHVLPRVNYYLAHWNMMDYTMPVWKNRMTAKACWSKKKYAIIEADDRQQASGMKSCLLVKTGSPIFSTWTTNGIVKGFKYKRSFDI
ncbi:hypothetical protein G9C98_001216, partial [Cotesia typhae]